MHRFALLAGTCLSTAAMAQSSQSYELAKDLTRAYEAELMADATSRTSYAEGASSGWNKGKFGITDGGANTLNIGGYFQTRYLLDARQDQADSNEITQGFQMRRTRLVATGSIWDKNLTFKIEGDFSRNAGLFITTDAFGRYQWDNGMHFRWGQFKLPLLREELVSSTLQLTAERSSVNTVFSQNRSQGVEFGYTDKKWRVMGALSDGINSRITDFDSEVADFGVTGRAEFMFAGEDWKRFDDNTSWQGSDYAGLLGGAVHYQSGGETGGTLDRDIIQATLDVSIEGGGWNAFIEGVYRNTDNAGVERDDFGIVAQAGIFATEQIEFFGRYDVIIPDTGDNFNTITAGLNYYISPKSHAVKFTGDVVYYVDPTVDNPLIGLATGVPVLVDPEGDQVALRLQMQIIF